MSQKMLVDEIDDLMKIQRVFASATNKDGLLGNKRKDGSVIEGIPENGLIGVLFDKNPDALVISTGGTAEQIGKAGYNVMEIDEYTGLPEMKTGLVKSMHHKIYMGQLAHPHQELDKKDMEEQGFAFLDMVLMNFYPFEQKVAENPLGGDPLAFEIIRQNMDVGGPTSTHASRKGFLATAVATRPEDYAMFIRDMKQYNGYVSFDSRFKAMQNVSIDLAQYFTAIKDFMVSATTEDAKAPYKTIHNPAGGS